MCTLIVYLWTGASSPQLLTHRSLSPRSRNWDTMLFKVRKNIKYRPNDRLLYVSYRSSLEERKPFSLHWKRLNCADVRFSCLSKTKFHDTWRSARHILCMNLCVAFTFLSIVLFLLRPLLLIATPLLVPVSLSASFSSCKLVGMFRWLFEVTLYEYHVMHSVSCYLYIRHVWII